MEPEGSSPHSQKLATCPYPEPDQSSLRPHTQPLEDHSITLSVKNHLALPPTADVSNVLSLSHMHLS
jgi:hypothetical protein